MLYRYQFTDDQGRLMEGTVQAPSEWEAFQALEKRGFNQVRLFPATKSQVASAPASIYQPLNIPPSAYAPHLTKVNRTRKGKDNQRFFLFSQIAERLKAGVNPVQCFEDLARYEKNKIYRQSLIEMARTSTDGGSLSSVLERYPDLYPAHTVGMVRAGENGGFLPEAFRLLSVQAQDAHKFKRFHWFVWLVGINVIFGVPLILAFRSAIISAATKSEAGQIRDPGAFLVEFIRTGATTSGIILAIALPILILLYWWFGRREMTRFRHSLGLKFPYYGPRARNESIKYFSAAMANLAKAGIAPQTTWKLAAETAPNLIMSDRLKAAGSQMNAGTRISEVVFGSKLFPDQFAPMIATGEMVGNIEGALEHLREATQTEFETSTAKARYHSMSFGCIAILLVGGLWLIIFAKTFYQDVIKIFVGPGGL